VPSIDAPTSQQWEQLWLPLWPRASDQLWEGIYRMSRASALGRRYIEANPQAVSNLLVVDIDHPDALLRALDGRRGWLPNAVVENRANGHAHAIWGVTTPIPRTEYAHRKPLAYAAAVTEGLRRSVDGDKGYSGLMTKNPTHDAWDASWLTDDLYALGELAEHLGEFMPPPSWSRIRRRNPVGLGRNCAIFETARHWAYREVRHHWGDPVGLRHAISAQVHQLNGEFSEPLPLNETSDITTSIWRWITTKSRIWADGPTVYEATFATIQAARSRKASIKRRGDKRDLALQLIDEAQHD
jgi:hypothetical protein